MAHHRHSDAEEWLGGRERGTSPFDHDYLRFREAQLDELDRDYADFCREREQQFRDDFHAWRNRPRDAGSDELVLDARNPEVISEQAPDDAEAHPS